MESALDHDLDPKRTPLFDHHRKLSGKLVEFAGWHLPIQYSGIVQEHRAVRQAAGIFDVSHMGEIFVQGPEAENAVNYLTCNDVATLSDGKAQYSAILNEKGGVIDDVIVYRFSREKYLLCVNASNTAVDFTWVSQRNKFKAQLTDNSSEYGQLALQGPRAEEIIAKLSGGDRLRSISYFAFTEFDWQSLSLIVARTGYTGEDGFEIFVPWNDTASLWEELLGLGAPHGLVPAGLGARDSLRLEACYPLHGHELAQNISAFESGLAWAVKLEKGEFIGREALREEKARGSRRGLIGFFVEDAGIVRQGDRLFDQDGAEIGVVTSGTKTPTLDRALGLGLVSAASTKSGTPIFAEVRGKKLACRVVKRPFYSNVKKQ